MLPLFAFYDIKVTIKRNECKYEYSETEIEIGFLNVIVTEK